MRPVLSARAVASTITLGPAPMSATSAMVLAGDVTWTPKRSATSSRRSGMVALVAVRAREVHVLGGTAWLPIQHDGNRSASDEEVEVVVNLVEHLMGAAWVDENGIKQAP